MRRPNDAIWFLRARVAPAALWANYYVSASGFLHVSVASSPLYCISFATVTDTYFAVVEVGWKRAQAFRTECLYRVANTRYFDSGADCLYQHWKTINACSGNGKKDETFSIGVMLSALHTPGEIVVRRLTEHPHVHTRTVGVSLSPSGGIITGSRSGYMMEYVATFSHHQTQR